MLQGPLLLSRIRGHVATALDTGHVTTLAETARALGLSTRSLVRVLTQNGITHYGIVESERRARAAHLLAQPALSLGEIAERLGFTDPSSFGRKCRTWFGDSPSRARRQFCGNTAS
jgi:AraC-like DNA-binding protein